MPTIGAGIISFNLHRVAEHESFPYCFFLRVFISLLMFLGTKCKERKHYVILTFRSTKTAVPSRLKVGASR
jgi:hypothetical protein